MSSSGVSFRFPESSAVYELSLKICLVENKKFRAGLLILYEKELPRYFNRVTSLRDTTLLLATCPQEFKHRFLSHGINLIPTCRNPISLAEFHNYCPEGYLLVLTQRLLYVIQNSKNFRLLIALSQYIQDFSSEHHTTWKTRLLSLLPEYFRLHTSDIKALEKIYSLVEDCSESLPFCFLSDAREAVRIKALSFYSALTTPALQRISRSRTSSLMTPFVREILNERLCTTSYLS